MGNRTNNAQQVREMLETLGLSQRAGAAMLQVNERTMRGWCADKPPAPQTVIFALQYLILQADGLKNLHGKGSVSH
ncbi:hypothetical protein UFOVP605_32 [uncultured Caudovirales phage]|uniref:Uncharacterized protein n=1 Tax=uncultured Caudovirales phage TaxID=2100421 RepID=A0A6J5N6V0_9CAUD|nr:hypothetical protein UFOVP605_32 [uncultured Caudovirales phage]